MFNMTIRSSILLGLFLIQVCTANTKANTPDSSLVEVIQRKVKGSAEYFRSFQNTNSCADYRTKLYRTEDGVKKLKIALFFSYMNFPETSESRFKEDQDQGPHYKSIYTKILTSKCRGEFDLTCGFRKLDNILVKNVNHDEQEVVIELSLNSATPKVIENPSLRREELNVYASDWVSKLKKSLEEDSLVIVDGHSRSGAGPSPYYPDSISSNPNQVISNWLSEKDLDNFKIEAPKLGQEQLRAFLTCKSKKYFLDDLVSDAYDNNYLEHLGFLTTTDDIYQEDVVSLTFFLLESFISGACPDDIKQRAYYNELDGLIDWYRF